jgi:hypothetical protein
MTSSVNLKTLTCPQFLGSTFILWNQMEKESLEPFVPLDSWLLSKRRIGF